MPPVLPPSFLFRYTFASPELGSPLTAGSVELGEEHRLPFPGLLDGRKPFATVKTGWNRDGLGISVEVTGKKKPLTCDAANPTEADGMQLWIDTRDTQSIHRASRFCHHFCVLPTGGGRKKREPTVIPLPIARAKGDARLADSSAIPVFANLRKTGYRVTIWLPAETLHGFDPESVPRLGFFYLVRDAELGDQTLTVGEEFPYAHDPSIWSTLELVSE